MLYLFILFIFIYKEELVKIRIINCHYSYKCNDTLSRDLKNVERFDLEIWVKGIGDRWW